MTRIVYAKPKAFERPRGPYVTTELWGYHNSTILL
jgi:hypothetical protein